MPREEEQDGREYYFWRKEDVLQKIRDKEMVEWGELDNQFYGKSHSDSHHKIHNVLNFYYVCYEVVLCFSK